MRLNGRWRLLDLSYSSAFKNLALEEALARCNRATSIPTVRTWTNPPTVVVGRFQEISAEVDVDACRQSNVEIARRFTGGGAVFHDEGNLNLTMVAPRQRDSSLDNLNRANCAVVLDLLDQLGVEGKFVPPNSIEISGKKVSGAAAALGRDFALWHASILISTDTQLLGRVLFPSQTAKVTTFIRSRWQPVITLDGALGRHVELEDVKQKLVDSYGKVYGAEPETGRLFADEEHMMKSLYTVKYRSREWNLHGTWGSDY
jgi:lipoate-protein ligase A